MRRRRLPRKEEEPATPLDPAKARERVFQRAAKLLTAKQRSVAELRERLLEGRGATKALVEEVIARLSEYGYLDDAKFAQSYATLRLRERPISRRRLQRDLWLKKVDKQTAEAALDEVFEATPEEELIVAPLTNVFGFEVNRRLGKTRRNFSIISCDRDLSLSW